MRSANISFPRDFSSLFQSVSSTTRSSLLLVLPFSRTVRSTSVSRDAKFRRLRFKKFKSFSIPVSRGARDHPPRLIIVRKLFDNQRPSARFPAQRRSTSHRYSFCWGLEWELALGDRVDVAPRSNACNGRIVLFRTGLPSIRECSRKLFSRQEIRVINANPREMCFSIFNWTPGF